MFWQEIKHLARLPSCVKSTAYSQIGMKLKTSRFLNPFNFPLWRTIASYLSLVVLSLSVSVFVM